MKTFPWDDKMKRMSKKLTWYGHNCFSFEYGKTVFILDPFLVEGISPISSQDLRADYLLVSHGHSDHCFNVLEIARHTNAKIIANAEIANFFFSKGTLDRIDEYWRSYLCSSFF